MDNVLYEGIAKEAWPYRSGLGGHRVLLKVTSPADVAEASLCWRRRDLFPEKIGMRLVCLEDGSEIYDIDPVTVTRTELLVRFRAPKEGLYGLYYLPCKLGSGFNCFEKTDHLLRSEMRAEESWLKKAAQGGVPADVLGLEARNDFERFTPGETPASPAEAERFAAELGNKPFAVYGESRDNPIKMTDEIPYHWTFTPAGQPLSLSARPCEELAYQICVYAVKELHNLTLTGAQCLNTAGRDWLGKPYASLLTVPAGHVQTLWCYETLPETEGELHREVTVSCDEGSFTLPVAVQVAGEKAERGNEDAPEKFTRLSWFDSDRGRALDTLADYPPVGGSDDTFTCEGRKVVFDGLGLPKEMVSTFTPDLTRTDGEETPILQKGVSFTFDANGNRFAITPRGTTCKVLGSGARDYFGGGDGDGFTITTVTRAEADGHLDTVLTLTATKDLSADNIQFSYEMSPDCARYAAGFGLEGCKAPLRWFYTWDERFANNMFWLGGMQGGLQVKLKHTQEVWEVYNYKSEGLPASWNFDGRGYVEVLDGKLTAWCGNRSFKAGESMQWRFAFLITPLMHRNMEKHWAQRYHHIDTWEEAIPNLDEAREAGATVVNLHQGGALNAYINYPFLRNRDLKNQITRAHEMGLKYKLYYTVREITNHVCEMPVLQSLGGEVLRQGEGFRLADHFVEKGSGTGVCGPWLKEHLREGCVPAWQQPLADGDLDSAVATTGLSRWHNYYIEGLRYLMHESGMDGIYLDGVGYDREIMKRVRKTMDGANPGSYIDFHSGNNFAPMYGMVNPIMQYLELFPCVDRLWIGEGYDFNKTDPDYWLVEMTGIPFGLTGEMLGPGGGNQWKGMVFGMSCRMGWQQRGDPVPLWRAWDKMGLTGSNMIGWWQKDCPVATGRDMVKATLFENGGKRFIAVASWEKEPVEITLSGMKYKSLHAPEIETFQKDTSFAADKPIPMEPGKGWLFEVME